MSTVWLRNEQQRLRYSVKSNRALERMREQGRLPPSQYPFGNGIPANTEEELDAWDRAAVARPRPRRAKPDFASKSAQQQAQPEN
jgi:hypothetical protein